LLDAVNLVVSNLDHIGGSMFGSFGFPGERWAMRGASHKSAREVGLVIHLMDERWGY
jgi:hypothetical protein